VQPFDYAPDRGLSRAERRDLLDDILSKLKKAPVEPRAWSLTYTDPATLGGQAAFLYALAHNKVITDPVEGTFTVYDTDDTTVLYVADLWQDAAGTTPYSGSGSERRDQMA
jgi:hypothetical protein